MRHRPTRRPGLRTWLLLLFAPIGLGGAILFLPLHPTQDLARFPVAAAADSVVVTAGARYRAGALHRFLLGGHYRSLWTQPITVEVLRLHDFDGGLQPTREGGGVQTRTLHFLSGSGRRYIFRSLEKENSRLLDYRLGRSLLAWLLNDQASSSHPASALIAAPLQAAAGLPAPLPRLVVLPRDSALGVFAARFGGLLGTLLESPGEYLNAGADSGAAAVKDTPEVLALLDSTSSHQVDTRAFLTARLLDLFLNDWDRHPGQWRWAPQSQSWGTVWRPIPTDRDQAFSWYDGVVLKLVRLRQARLATFGPEYPGLGGLTWNGRALDRRLLAGLSRGAWDSTASWLEARLTDSVIDAATRAMPAPYWRVSGPALAATLKRRRDGLQAVATQFYLRLARMRAPGFLPAEPPASVRTAPAAPRESGAARPR